MKNEIITFITAALPVIEVRGSIPVAMGVFGFSWLKAYLISVAGNMFLIIPAFIFLQKFSEFLMRKWYLFNRLMSWVFDRTRRKHLDHFHEKRWVELALFIFVAIPLPLTGAWSGVVAAYLLGIPFWRAMGAIFLGVMAAAAIVTVLFSMGLLVKQTVG